MTGYRVVQEALTNALKHAGPAATVRVELAHHPDRVELTVLGRCADCTAAAAASEPELLESDPTAER